MLLQVQVCSCRCMWAPAGACGLLQVQVCSTLALLQCHWQLAADCPRACPVPCAAPLQRSRGQCLVLSCALQFVHFQLFWLRFLQFCEAQHLVCCPCVESLHESCVQDPTRPRTLAYQHTHTGRPQPGLLLVRDTTTGPIALLLTELPGREAPCLPRCCLSRRYFQRT